MWPRINRAEKLRIKQETRAREVGLAMEASEVAQQAGARLIEAWPTLSDTDRAARSPTRAMRCSPARRP